MFNFLRTQKLKNLLNKIELIYFQKVLLSYVKSNSQSKIAVESNGYKNFQTENMLKNMQKVYIDVQVYSITFLFILKSVLHNRVKFSNDTLIYHEK